MNKPAYLLDIPAKEYHAATKNLEFLSSHRLNLFRRCPALYIKHANGEIVEDDTAAFILGRATHTRIIEGAERFAAEYVVADGPENPKTGKPYGRTTDKYREWADAQTRPVIATEDAELIAKMDAAVHAHEKAAELLSAGFAEATVRGEWDGVPTQIRADWYDPERNILVDLKTCADVDRFQYDVRDYGYVFQLAYYAHQIAAARPDGKTPDCWIVAVEKREPFRVLVVRVLPYTIDVANNEDTPKNGPCNANMIAELKECRAANKWPTRYEGFEQI